jgi:hypothetical protein
LPSMETESLFPGSEESDIGFCFAPEQFTPLSHITFLHSSIYAPKSQPLSFLHLFEYNILCINHIPFVCCMSHIRLNHLCFTVCNSLHASVAPSFLRLPGESYTENTPIGGTQMLIFWSAAFVNTCKITAKLLVTSVNTANTLEHE